MADDIYTTLGIDKSILKRDYIKNPLKQISKKTGGLMWERPYKEDLNYLYNEINLSIHSIALFFNVKDFLISSYIKEFRIYKDKKSWHELLLKSNKIKYGNEYYNNSIKTLKTKQSKYGKFKYKKYIKNPLQLQIYGKEIYSIISDKEKIINYLKEHSINNRNKLQELFHISRKSLERLIKKYHLQDLLSPKQTNEEIFVYEKIKTIFPMSKNHYKSEKYPFMCDFYIPEIDTYIEYQGFWTHGGEPYIGTDKQKEKVKLWESKNKPQYNKAINEWTIRDPLKRKTAKDNGLKWLEFFNLNQFMEWYNIMVSLYQ